MSKGYAYRKDVIKIKAIILVSDENKKMMDYEVLGKPLINYTKDLIKDLVKEIIIVDRENIKNLLENMECENVLLTDGTSPQISAEEISDLIESHKKTKANISYFPDEADKFYIVRLSYFKNKSRNDLGRMLRTYRSVDSRMKLMEMIELIKININIRHIENGVYITDPNNSYIDADVEIGKNTLIEPGCVIKSACKIGENCIIGHNSKLENTRVDDNVTIENSVIRDSHIKKNATIGPFAYIRPNSIIGENVKIGNFVEIKNSTIGANTSASHLTYVGDADVGENVNFGCGSILVNYDGVDKHRSTIEDGAFIGCNTNLVSPVRVGERAFTAAGSTITKDLASESLGISRVEQKNIKGWVGKRHPKDK